MGARGGGPQLVAPDVSSAHVLVWFVRGFFGRRLLFCLARAHFFGSSRLCCCGSLVSVSCDEERRERMSLEFLPARGRNYDDDRAA
jgi:hypothetical protein